MRYFNVESVPKIVWNDCCGYIYITWSHIMLLRQRDIEWTTGAWALWLCDPTCHQVPFGCTAELTCLHVYGAQSAAIAPLRRGAPRHCLHWGSLFWEPCTFSFWKLNHYGTTSASLDMLYSYAWAHTPGLKSLQLGVPLSGSTHLREGTSGRGVFPALSKGGRAVKQRVAVHA